MYERRRRVRPVGPEQTITPWPFVGMALMGCDFFLCGASALLTPLWVTVLLLGAWALLMVQCTRWWTPHPRRLVPAALALAVVWFATLVGGAALLGWSS